MERLSSRENWEIEVYDQELVSISKNNNIKPLNVKLCRVVRRQRVTKGDKRKSGKLFVVMPKY